MSVRPPQSCEVTAVDEHLVTLNNVGHCFAEGRWLFTDLNCVFLPDHVYGVTGPSGSGKSTLLGVLAGWITPRQGEVDTRGIRSIRWVFQNPYGIAHRTVLDHVVVPLLGRGVDREAAETQAMELLATFGLTDVAGEEFGCLSGGEAQRLMLARGIASKPDLLLVDEPTAQLDRTTAAEVNDALVGLAGQGVIVVIATHDANTRAMCTDVIDLEECEEQSIPAATHIPTSPIVPTTLRGTDSRPVIHVRWKESLREAWRNVATSTSHAVSWAIVLTVIVGGLGWLDANATRSVIDGAVNYINRGGATWVLQVPGMIDGRACDALTESGRVVNAGALRQQRDNLPPTVLPRTGIPLFEVTPGFRDVLGVDVSEQGAGLWLSDSVADGLGLTIGNSLELTTGSVLVDGVFSYPADGRSSGLGYSVLSPTAINNGYFDQCWFTVWPPDESTLSLSRIAIEPVSDPTAMPHVQINQLNPTLASQFTGQEDYLNRPTRLFGCIALLMGIVVGFTATWFRRLEYASMLHAGLPKSFLLLQSEIETLLWGLAAVSLAVPIVLLVAANAYTDNATVSVIGLRPLITGLIGVLIGTALTILLIRERNLFTLFKNR